MYRCQLCGVVVQPNTPCRKLVIETRRKAYTERRDSNRIRIQGKKKPMHIGDPGGMGWEIVREVKVCRACNEKWMEEHQGEVPLPPALPTPIIPEIVETPEEHEAE